MSSWLFAAYIVVIFILNSISLLNNTGSRAGRAAIYNLIALFAVACTGMIVTTFLVTKSEPNDPVVQFERLIRSQPIIKQQFIDYIEKHASYFCSICDTHVFAGSKHCSICNRCCYEFDHHCRWVSNDIGRLNYILFIRMLLFTMSTLLLQLI